MMFRASLYCMLAIFALPLCSCNKSKYGGPTYEQELYQGIEKYALTYADSHKMQLVNVGLFGELEKSTLLWSFWLRASHTDQLQDCRKQMIYLAKDYWTFLKKNPFAKVSFENSTRFKDLNGKMVIKLCGIKIDYWNSFNNRPPLPYIAQAFFRDGKFYYYQADPRTQALVLIKEESYEEAMRQS